MALFHVQFLTDYERLLAVEILDNVGDARHGLPDNRMLINERHLEALQRHKVKFRFVERKEEVRRGPRPPL